MCGKKVRHKHTILMIIEGGFVNEPSAQVIEKNTKVLGIKVEDLLK
jgi:hypothetical protein